MANAALSVKHYVSDCLEERHPYDVRKGFGGRAERDAGLVFDGFLPGGVDQLLGTLSDPSIEDDERAKAVHHLYSHSASQEMKIVLLEKGVVPLVVAVLRRRPFHLLEHQCYLLLRSLSVIPQGCFCVVDGGGAEAAIRSIYDLEEAEVRLEARAAAMQVLQQVSSNFAGLRWLLRAEDCAEFKLQTADAPPAPVLVQAEDVISAIGFVFHHDDMNSRIALSAVTTLAQVTAITQGINAAIANSPLMESLATMLAALADALAAAQNKDSHSFLTQLLTALWNISLDQCGVEAVEEHGVPELVVRVFCVSSAAPDALSRFAHRSLMGALSAMYKLTSLKLASVEPLGTFSSRVLALISFLQWVNGLVDTAKKNGREPSADVIAISKNTVQCLRLASEVRAVRNITHSFLDSLAQSSLNEAFYFRRQLYFSTAWEAEYDAHVQ